MKKLQNNFTTFNQIVRLQELGVPADSADMYIECYWCYGGNSRWRHKVGSHEMFGDRKQIGEGVGAIRPCWSVGRLIEIYLLCAELKKPQMIFIKENVLIMDRMINELCYMAESERLDFSKLEE